MAKYEYLLFDMDGTIVNTFEGVSTAFAYALNSYGIVVKDRKELLPVLGPPLRESFVKLYGFSEDEALKAVAKYREYYVDHFLEESQLYDGVRECFEKFYAAGFKLVLATSKPEKFSKEMLDYYDLSKYFYFITGATFDRSRDTKTAVLEHIFKMLQLKDLSKSVMIGDRKFDLEGAVNVGIDAIGVTYGFGSAEELSSYPNVFLANSMKDLYNYIIG